MCAGDSREAEMVIVSVLLQANGRPPIRGLSSFGGMVSARP
jgi:hypothetical protein